MPDIDTDDALRPCSRRVSLTSVNKKATMTDVIMVIDKIAELMCPEHDLNPAIATTFSGSGYVSACCEDMLDKIEALVRDDTE